MCGIFGIVLPEGQKPEASIVEKATDSLRHRGPDDSGYFFYQNVALGNRRLAILDTSSEGKMPMAYGNLQITYNGELYNYIELREELIKLGYSFRTATDTEVIVAAYQEWGAECEKQFNGMWAFAIFDQEKSQLFCSRDRFGIKPFFYQNDEKFVFASEIKALKTLPSWKFKINEQLAGDFLVRGMQHHTNDSLFDGVKQLPAGHQLIFDCKNGELNIRQYYDLSALEKKEQLTFEQATNQFKKLLTSSIQEHLRSDVKVGAALSGGLDSSTLVALLTKLLADDKQLETVSYASTISEFDESKYVDHLIERYPVKLHCTTSDFELSMSLLDEVILAHDEPLLSASLVAQYLVFRQAKKQDLKVMLDGQGADELLAGYGTYYIPFFKELLKKNPLNLIFEILGVIKYHGFSFKNRLSKKTKRNKFFRFDSEPMYIDKSHFKAYEKFMITTGILPYLLHFDDRNSMANSVESRVPFLDHRLVEFCLSLPVNFKIKNGVRKRILRAAMKEELPNSILKRYDKMGFPTPQNRWMALHPQVFIDKIASHVNRFPEWVDKAYLEFAKEALLSNKVQEFAGIWRMISFFRWVELEEGK